VLKNIHTNKWTILKTSTSLHYAKPVEDYISYRTDERSFRHVFPGHPILSNSIYALSNCIILTHHMYK